VLEEVQMPPRVRLGVVHFAPRRTAFRTREASALPEDSVMPKLNGALWPLAPFTVAMNASGLATLLAVVLVGVQHERPLPGANVVCEG
jgi:hypothetical protein